MSADHQEPRLSKEINSPSAAAEPYLVIADQVIDNSEIEMDPEDSEEDAQRPLSPTKVTVKQAEGVDLPSILIGRDLSPGKFKRIKNDVCEPNFGVKRE